MVDNKTLLCPECQNSIELDSEIVTGDVVECPHCGSELRITGFDAEGKALVSVIEEEK